MTLEEARAIWAKSSETVSVVLEELKKRDMTVSWIHYFSECAHAGMGLNRAFSRVLEGVADAFGRDYKNALKAMLEERYEARVEAPAAPAK